MKKNFYIFAFMVLGALTGFLVTAVALAWALSAPSIAEQLGRLIVFVPMLMAVIGAMFGILLGKFFWPRLYKDDGSLRIIHWKTWLKHPKDVVMGFAKEEKA